MTTKCRRVVVPHQTNHHQLVDICFSTANASRCTLICSTSSITNGWLNLPCVESKNSWCFFGHSSRFSYSNACKTISNRSKSLTNFDSGVTFSSYSYKMNLKQKKLILSLERMDGGITECICEYYGNIVIIADIFYEVFVLRFNLINGRLESNTQLQYSVCVCANIIDKTIKQHFARLFV